MAVGDRYSNDVLRLNYNDGGTQTAIMNGITSLDISNNKTLVVPAGGDAYPDQHTVQTWVPEIGLGIENLLGILTHVGLHGRCLQVVSAETGATVFTQAHDLCGATGRKSGSNHGSARIEHGRVIIESINASPPNNAVANIRIHGAQSDRTVDPLIVAHNAALPTVDAGLLNLQYLLGRVRIGGAAIQRVTNVSIAYNATVNKPAVVGQLAPKEVFISRVSPVVTITTEDVTLHDSSIGKFGSSITHANSDIQFVLRDGGAGLVDDATANHLKATINGSAHVRQIYTASGTATGTSVITVNCEDDGTNAPIVWDLASTYTP